MVKKYGNGIAAGIPSKSSFGTCDFDRTSPRLPDLGPTTDVLNVVVSFEDALKLNLAIDECLRKLNSYKRSTAAGRRSAMRLAIYFKKGKITVNEASIRPSRA